MRGTGLRVTAIAGSLAMATSLVTVAPSSAAPSGLEGIPHYDHVVVLVEENESFSATFGSGSPAKFLNQQLVPRATLADQYFAVGHVSLDNYISMTSGQPGVQGATNTDCLGISLFVCATLASTPSSRNLADQLEENGFTWKEYADGTNKPCVHDVYSTGNPLTPDSYQGDGATPTNNGAGKDYADRHNPWLYYTNIIGSTASNGQGPRCVANVRPFTEMAGAMATNTLPAFSFITPDTCNDGHDSPCAGKTTGGLAAADAWLQGPGNVTALLQYLLCHNGLLILTFDEAQNTDVVGCCHGGPLGAAGAGGRVGLLAFGPRVQSGRVIHTAYDHASLLRTIEDSFGISEHLGNAGSNLLGASQAMSDLFVPSSSTGPPPGCPASASGPSSNPNAVGQGNGLPNTSAASPLANTDWLLVGFVVLLAALGIGARRSAQD